MVKDIRDAFFDEIYEIAKKDNNVIFISADADAFSLRKYKKDFPDRFINVGCAEQNMISIASGLALSGKKVFIYAIIPFITMRCFEHIKVNICSMNLPVTIIGAGAGLSFGNDGATHHGVSDISIMRTLPELEIYNPSDFFSAKNIAKLCYENNHPNYVRIDKGKLPDINKNTINYFLGFSILKNKGSKCVISTGFMSHKIIEIFNEIDYEFSVIDLFRIKPFPIELLQILDKYEEIMIIEENCLTGGIGSLLLEELNDNDKNIPVKRVALKDEQCYCYGDREWLHEYYKINKDAIKKIIIN